MCHKCDEKLAPVQSVLGKLTAVERHSALITLALGTDPKMVIAALQEARKNKLEGSATNPFPPEIDSMISQMQPQDFLDVLGSKPKASVNSLKSILGELEELLEGGPEFNQEDVEAKLGRELTPLEEEAAFSLAMRGYTIDQVIAFLNGDTTARTDDAEESSSDPLTVHVFQVADHTGKGVSKEFVAIEDYNALEEKLHSTDLVEQLKAAKAKIAELQALTKH